MALYHILPFMGLSRRKRGIMYGNIAHVLESGIPVIRGMQILEEQAHNRRFRSIFKKLKDHINDGGNLGSALETMPEFFPKHEAQVIASTETAGTAPLTFQRLSEFLIWYSDTVRQALLRLIYPAFLLIFAVIGVPVIIAVGTGKDPSVVLPFIYTVLCSFFFFIILFRLLMLVSVFRHLYQRIILYIPWIGAVSRQLARARFARTYECMVTAGVPYFHGLQMAAESCGNVVMQKKIQKVIPLIQDGISLSSALKDTYEFTPLSLGILEVGEESGSMDDCLRRFSHEEEQKAMNNIHAMGVILPVVIMVAIMLFVVIFVILPGFQGYFDLLNSIH